MALTTIELAQRLTGVWTALVTPFRGGKFDAAKMAELVERQIEAGVSGLVPCGTTGESPTLSFDEHGPVVETVVKAARGRVPVVAGAGTNSTAEAIDMCRTAKAAGADGVLVVAPYYNRPTQRGLFEHYRAVFEAVDIPVVMYNIPGRTGVNVEPETMGLLRPLGKLAGVKESAGSCDQVGKIFEACGNDFAVLSGDDSMTLPFMSLGAKGVVSVTSNIVPKELVAMVAAYLAGKTVEALEMHRRLFPLMKSLFIETNPGPVKTAMGLMGLCTDELRLPMASMEEDNVVRLRKALQKFGLKV